MKPKTKPEAAPAQAGDYHVIRTSGGRTELQRGNKPVGDLTASPAISESIVDILVGHAALLSERDRLRAALQGALNAMRLSRHHSQQEFYCYKWRLEPIEPCHCDICRVISALSEGGK